MSSVHRIAEAATDPADNPVLQAALDYAARGLPVFPVRPDKRPYTAHGFKDATTDQVRITRWWTDWPAALIAMPTGGQTDLHVIDVDVHSHDGFQALKKLDFSREGVPCVATPSGGNHFYHRLGGLVLKNSVGKLGPGVDTRGEGGYIIVPPSRPDPDKPGYQFISPAVDLLAAPIIPKELGEKLKDRSKPTATDALKLECERVAAASPGSRNQILNTAAFKLAKLVAAGKLDENEVREALTKSALAVGLEPDEIEKTLDSALTAGKRDAAVSGTTRTPRQSKAQGRPLELPDPEPWPEPMNGAELLDAMVYDLCSYVIMTAYQAYAVVLWALHAFAVDIFAITPRLAITSPLPDCGKTTLLDWIGTVVPRKIEACNISPAAAFRTIEAAKPTLLIDEADTFLKDNPELKGILNSGHRRGGHVIRVEGDAHEARMFATFCACAIALIGKLSPTYTAAQSRLPCSVVGQMSLCAASELTG